MSKYTKEDFANAEFARHPDGRIAARLYPGLKEQWAMFESAWGSSDHRLAIDGWTPISDEVPGRTITESALSDLYDSAHASGGEFRAALFDLGLGITVVPDPEPTNAEKIEALLRAADEANADQEFGRFARYLDEQGVKAPEAGGDDEH